MRSRSRFSTHGSPSKTSANIKPGWCYHPENQRISLQKEPFLKEIHLLTGSEGPKDPIHIDDQRLKIQKFFILMLIHCDGSEVWLVHKLKSERTIDEVPTVEKKSDILLLPVRLNSIFPWFFFPKKCLLALNDVFLPRKLTVCFNKLLQRVGDWQDHVPTWKVEIVPSPIGVSGARSPGTTFDAQEVLFFFRRWERC